MCLAVPAKIVHLEGSSAVVDLHGNRIQISTLLTPEAGLNDWVLVHAGFAIQQLDAATAAETFSIMRDLGIAGPAGGDRAGAAEAPPATLQTGGVGGGRHA